MSVLCNVVIRTLTGHKSSVRSMDFHPYGNYVASGSADTNIKVRKLCIHHRFVMLKKHCDYLCLYITL